MLIVKRVALLLMALGLSLWIEKQLPIETTESQTYLMIVLLGVAIYFALVFLEHNWHGLVQKFAMWGSIAPPLNIEPPPRPPVKKILAPAFVTIHWSNDQSWRTNNLTTTCMEIVEWLQKKQGLEDITFENYGESWRIIHQGNITRVVLKRDIELGRLTPDMPNEFWIEVF